jgi:hypothetical protein
VEFLKGTKISSTTLFIQGEINDGLCSNKTKIFAGLLMEGSPCYQQGVFLLDMISRKRFLSRRMLQMFQLLQKQAVVEQARVLHPHQFQP